MLESNKVQSSEEGKAKLREKYKEKKLSIQELAELANVSSDTVQRLLGTRQCPNGVERWAVKNIAKALGIEPTDIVDPKDWYTQYEPPAEFKSVIQDTIKEFCGREFVFNEIDKFINDKTKGYFTIVGDAGMGKTSLLAKLIYDRHYPCYFNIRSNGNNSPNLFLNNIRQQLIQRYQLQGAEVDSLSILLEKVSQKLLQGERLIIVVDALDEVDQQPVGNLLYLPIHIPERVYFILTRRPYEPEQKRLSLSPEVPEEELDLRRKYVNLSRNDVEKYIRLFLYEDSEHKEGLIKWIQDSSVTNEAFVEQVAEKSENNFMYLKCLLPDIARGLYARESLDKLPAGLAGYYEKHWQIMGMTAKPLPRNKIKIVYVMSALPKPASRPIIAKYAKQSELTVQEVLKDWAQFLEKKEEYNPPRYRFYHESFREFLNRKDIVQAAGVNLPEISAEVAASITEGVFGDG